MKITICGSIAFFEEMLDAKAKLEALGHEVKLPPTEVPDENGNMIPVAKYYELRKTVTDEKSWIWDKKKQAMLNHFEKEVWADAVLIMNCDKKGIPGYIGANTLIEMGMALYLKKPIYMINPIPEISYKEEILGMKPIVIGQNFEVIGSERLCESFGSKQTHQKTEEIASHRESETIRGSSQRLKVVVASKNPVKIAAAVKGFKEMFSNCLIEVSGISVPSGVPDQPMSSDEALAGAFNRANNASLAETNADYWVGLEGGVEETGGEMQSFAWIVVKDRKGNYGKGKTGVFVLPPKIRELIKQGLELGQADDVVFGKTNSKQENGAVGLLTDDAIDRASFYTQAVIFALIPFRNQQLYESEKVRAAKEFVI